MVLCILVVAFPRCDAVSQLTVHHVCSFMLPRPQAQIYRPRLLSLPIERRDSLGSLAILRQVDTIGHQLGTIYRWAAATHPHKAAVSFLFLMGVVLEPTGEQPPPKDPTHL